MSKNINDNKSHTKTGNYNKKTKYTHSVNHYSSNDTIALLSRQSRSRMSTNSYDNNAEDNAIQSPLLSRLIGSKLSTTTANNHVSTNNYDRKSYTKNNNNSKTNHNRSTENTIPLYQYRTAIHLHPNHISNKSSVEMHSR